MSLFEIWQIVIGVLQSVILVCTLFAAIYIGRKQAEISKRQADISEVQTNINKSLADLPFVVSVEVVYDAAQKRINVVNKGQTNIYLWGTKLGELPRAVEKEPRLIVPGGFYYLLAETLESQLLAHSGPEPASRRTFGIYLTSQNGVKYVVRTLLISERCDNRATIHTQTIAIQPEEWLSAG